MLRGVRRRRRRAFRGSARICESGYDIRTVQNLRLRAGAENLGTSYLKVEHPPSGYAVCGAAAVVGFALDGSCATASLCFNGVTAVPHRAEAVAAALVRSELADAMIDTAVDEHLAVGEPLSDLHASGEYRAHLAGAFGKRALKLARDRAREPDAAVC